MVLSEKDLKHYRIFLFALIFINFFAVLQFTPLFDLDEGAFSEATRELFIHNDFITTYLNNQLRFDKPILIYWLQALSISIFGEYTFAFRLPSAISATVWALSIYLFAKKLYNEKTAILATLFMVSSLQISLIAKAAIADALLNMFIALSMFSTFFYIKTMQKRYLYLAFGFIGFGMLTKGPVAVLIPLVTTFIYLSIKKQLKLFFKMIFDVKGIIIFSLIALPWYVAEYIQQGDKFIQGFFLKHNLQRFNTSFEGHRGSIFYYIPVLLVGVLPWTSMVFKYVYKLKDYIRQKDEFVLFGSIWFFFVLIFFSLSGTKLHHYVIYGYTPLFIFLALSIVKRHILLSLPLTMFSFILLILPTMLDKIKIKNELAKAIISSLTPYFDWFFYTSVGLIFILSIVNLKKYKIMFMAASMVFITNYLIWIYAHSIQFPIKHIAQYVKENSIKDVVMYKINTPSFIVYSKQFVEKRHPKKGDIVLTYTTQLKNFNYELLYKEGVVALIKIK